MPGPLVALWHCHINTEACAVDSVANTAILTSNKGFIQKHRRGTVNSILGFLTSFIGLFGLQHHTAPTFIYLTTELGVCIQYRNGTPTSPRRQDTYSIKYIFCYTCINLCVDSILNGSSLNWNIFYNNFVFFLVFFSRSFESSIMHSLINWTDQC